MTFRLRIAPLAQQHTTNLPLIFAATASNSRSNRSTRLDRILWVNLGESPLTWNYFALTGAPYRAYQFRVGRRTQFWIIYTVDEAARTIDILHF